MNQLSLTQFELSLKNTTVKGEYEGNPTSGKAVIFAHGFGVRRDSHGMFNELGDLLKEDRMVIRFDFTETLEEEGSIKVPPLSTQAEMLAAVLSYAADTLRAPELSIVAHSQGCLVTGLLSPDGIDKIILVASPIGNPYLGMKEYFGRREGTEIDEAGLSRLKKSTGWALLEPEFWQDIKAVDPVYLYQQLATKTNLFFIRAIHDHVIAGTDYQSIQNISGMTYQELPGDHNFSGEARQNWLATLAGILRE